MKRETDLEWNLGERQHYRPGRRAWTYREAAAEPGGRESNLHAVRGPGNQGTALSLEEGMPVSAESGMWQQA